MALARAAKEKKQPHKKNTAEYILFCLLCQQSLKSIFILFGLCVCARENDKTRMMMMMIVVLWRQLSFFFLFERIFVAQVALYDYRVSI